MQLNLSFADPDHQVVQNYTVNWGDGLIEQFNVNGNAGLNPVHTYSSGDITPTVLVYNVTTANHVYGVLGSLSVTVNDAAPTIGLSGSTQVIQGLPYSLAFGAVADPGIEEVLGYTVYWGDGSSDSFTGSPSSGATITHTYAAAGQQNIHVSLIDRDGTHPYAGQLSVSVLADQPPVANAGGPYVVAEGGTVVLDATQSADPDQTSSSLTYAWDFSGNGLFTDATGPNPTFSAAALDGPGQVTVRLEVTDLQGESSISTAVITIQNVAPTATLTNNGPVNEGSPVLVAFSGTFDPGAADVAAGLHFSYATSEAALATAYATATDGNSKAMTFDDNGSYVVWGRIIDKDGAFTDYSTTVTILDVAPTAVLTNNGPVNEGSPVTVGFTNTFDPSNADLAAGLHFSYALTEDGLSTTYAAATDGSTKSLTFDDNGSYTVWGRIIDKDGSFTDYSTSVTVLNVAPTAVFSNSGPVLEGSATATVSFSNLFDPSSSDQAAGFLYSYDFGNTGTFQIDRSTSSTANVPSAFLVDGPGTVVVRGRIIDKDGGFTDYLTTITIVNAPPTADFSNSGPVFERGTATVQFTNVSDPSSVDQSAGFTFSYDFNDDGTFEISNTGSTSVSVPSQLLDDGPSTVVIHGRITDKDGGSTDYTTTLIVQNVAPTAVLTNGGPVSGGAPAVVSFSDQFDPSNADTAAGFHYSFATSEAGLASTYAAAGTATSANFSFPSAGSYTIFGRIIDKDNGYTTYQSEVVVPMRLQPRPR